jgi:glyoxylase-like metal-dependent hydrolase (beta-lactamase superfamily II)
VAIVDTVKENFSEEFFRRLESVADYSEIRAIVLNHLEPDHSGALPELMRCAPQAQLYISQRATSMLKGLLKPRGEAFSRQAETGELRQLLRDGRAEDAADVAHIAVVVATACLGSDHLWQDLGVWNRADLSDLLSLYFPRLAARNTADMNAHPPARFASTTRPASVRRTDLRICRVLAGR